MKKTLLAISAVLVFSTQAFASLMLGGLVNGVTFCASDNNAGCGFGIVLPDTDPSVGQIGLATTTLGGVTVEGSFHSAVIGPPQNSLNSSSLQITNNTAGTINAQLAVGATNFVGPVSGIQTSGSGTWQNALGSTMQYSWYADGANGQGGESFNDLPGLLLATFNDLAGIGVDSFSTNNNVAFSDPNLFSMSLGMNMNLIAGGTLVSRGQNEIADLAPIPEPATMVLLGSGLIAAFRVRRKRV